MSTKEKEKFQRCSAKGNLILKAKELVSGGIYHPFAFPVLRVPVANEIAHLYPALSPGDLLQIKPSKLDMINLVDYNFGYKVSKYLVSSSFRFKITCKLLLIFVIVGRKSYWNSGIGVRLGVGDHHR